ncbi:MAG: S8/S53 family peptidase [Bacteroidia bacterium]
MRLYGNIVFQVDTTDTQEAIESAAAQATLEGALSTNMGGYGLHIMNNSWQRVSFLPILREQVEFAFKSGVVYTAGRGNGNVPQCSYPACFDSTRLIAVTSSDSVGEKAFAAAFGYGLDLMAPGIIPLVTTTGIQSNSHYESVFGSSFATPHVSGAAALILSYLNSQNSGGFKTAPEDVEFLLERYADDKGAVGHDSITGHGLVNVGKTMKMIEKPVYELWHLPTGTHTIRAETNLGSKTVLLTSPYQGLSAGYYNAVEYYVTAQYHHPIGANDSVMNCWIRNSSSEGISAANPIDPYTHIKLDSYNQNYAYLSAYTYHLTSTATFPSQSVNVWIPAPPSNIKFAYTLHTKDLLATKIDPVSEDHSAIIYPNPTKSHITVKCELKSFGDIAIDLFDLTGKHIHQEFYANQYVGEQMYTIDIQAIPSGIFVCRIQINGSEVQKKIIKLN